MYTRCIQEKEKCKKSGIRPPNLLKKEELTESLGTMYKVCFYNNISIKCEKYTVSTVDGNKKSFSSLFFSNMQREGGGGRGADRTGVTLARHPG
jgi:hypothetical protein